jgi:RNA-directed DNA polymerase
VITPAVKLPTVADTQESAKTHHYNSKEAVVVGSPRPATHQTLTRRSPNPTHPQIRRQYETTVPNVADRIAQTAAAMLLEEKLEPIFHQDSYGYRPGRRAHDALAVTRKRCWKQNWVIDLDIRAFFDSVPWDLTLKAVAHHTDERWVLLYMDRWLRAPIQMSDGTLGERERGPRRGPLSPVLANLFMHYAFDRWMVREYPGCLFERDADDAVIHCDTERQARHLRADLAERLGPSDSNCTPRRPRSCTARTRIAPRRRSTPASTFSVTPSGVAGPRAGGGSLRTSPRP